MKPPRTIQETLLALIMIAMGLFVFPAMIFFVGIQILGEYEAGLVAFYQSIGNALLSGSLFAWSLVLSPYLLLQLARSWLWLHRQRASVN